MSAFYPGFTILYLKESCGQSLGCMFYTQVTQVTRFNGRMVLAKIDQIISNEALLFFISQMCFVRLVLAVAVFYPDWRNMVVNLFKSVGCEAFKFSTHCFWYHFSSIYIIDFDKHSPPRGQDCSPFLHLQLCAVVLEPLLAWCSRNIFMLGRREYETLMVFLLKIFPSIVSLSTRIETWRNQGL